MKKVRKDINFDDLNIKIQIKNLLINIYYIRFMTTIPGSKIDNHCHSTYELHFIPAGFGYLISEGQSYPIVPGTFYLTGPGVYHEQLSDVKDPMYEYCINFDYEILKTVNNKETVPEEEIGEILKVLKDVRFCFGKDAFHTMNLFEQIEEELHWKLIGYYTSIKNHTTQIILNALRNYIKQSVSYVIPKKTLDDHRKQTIDFLFYNNYRELTMEQMAKAVGVGTRQLDRIVRQYYGLSFKEKLMKTKIDNAMYLLETTRLTVEEIALKTGFGSSSYFCRTFKSKTGSTPAERKKEGDSPVYKT